MRSYHFVAEVTFNIQFIFPDQSASTHLSTLLNNFSSILLLYFIKFNISQIMVFSSFPKFLSINVIGFIPVYILFILIKPFTSIVIIVNFCIFFFLKFIPSNVFWFHFCYPLILPYHPCLVTQALFCYFCAISFLADIVHSSLISSYWFALFIYRPTQRFYYRYIQCLCPCLSFLIVIVNIDIISIWWFTWKLIIKLVISILFPNKSSHFSSPKTITLSSLSTFKGVLFVVAWLQLPGTCPCILRLLGKRP